MIPLTDIGEVVLTNRGDGGRDYFLRPSFLAMTRIGSPAEIVSAYAIIHGAEAQGLVSACAALCSIMGSLPAWIYSSFERVSDCILAASIHVLQACCDDDLSDMTGEWGGAEGKIKYAPGLLSRHDIILIAQSLMNHGIIGRAKVRKLQRHESNDTTTVFDALEYINAARTHFEMSREDAANLTMTEFALLPNAKYPNQKGLTREEYDHVMDEDERRWQEMLAREQLQ